MTLDRYILRLWIVPFLTSLSLAIGILMLGRALKVLGLIAESDVDWSVIFLMLAAILPYFLVLTIPMASFFAMQAVIIRLQQDSELDALRAAGISYVRIFRSLMAVAVLLWAGLAYTAMEWMPQGQKAFQGFIYAMQHVKASPSFDPQRFNQDMDDFTVYVKGHDDEGRLLGFMLEDTRANTPVVYMAEWAKIHRIGEFLRFTLHHGTRLEGREDSLRAIAFDRYQVNVNVGQFGMLKMPSYSSNVLSMGMQELWHRQQGPKSLEAVAEWHRRLLLPTSVLLLMLFALPLSMEPKRSGKAGAYLLGVAVLLLVYNTQIVSHQQVISEALPWWVMWLTQGMIAIFAFELTRRTVQDRLPSLLSWIGQSFHVFRSYIYSVFAKRSDL